MSGLQLGQLSRVRNVQRKFQRVRIFGRLFFLQQLGDDLLIERLLEIIDSRFDYVVNILFEFGFHLYKMVAVVVADCFDLVLEAHNRHLLKLNLLFQAFDHLLELT